VSVVLQILIRIWIDLTQSFQSRVIYFLKTSFEIDIGETVDLVLPPDEPSRPASPQRGH
jgi:hypothetical protein